MSYQAIPWYFVGMTVFQHQVWNRYQARVSVWLSLSHTCELDREYQRAFLYSRRVFKMVSGVLLLLCFAIAKVQAFKISGYWGQNKAQEEFRFEPEKTEKNLDEACNNYGILYLSSSHLHETHHQYASVL